MFWYSPPKDRVRYVGDIFQASIALFLPNNKDAVEMRRLLGISEDGSRKVYDLLYSVAQRIDFLRDCSGLSLPKTLSYLLQRVHSTSFDELGFNNEDPFVSAGLNFVNHPGNAMCKRKSTEDAVNSDGFHKRFRHQSEDSFQFNSSGSRDDSESHAEHVSRFVQGVFFRYFTVRITYISLLSFVY